jgi:diguanylate cyclase (GGDEF)-like protein/PAS domain S-box-containing protein
MKLEKFVQRKKDTASLDVSLQDIVEQMFKYSLRYVVIVKNKIPIGILTERDILSLFHENIDFKTMKIARFALKKLVKANKKRELEYALNLMIDHNIRRVIVIDDEGKYQGCVEQEEIIFEFEAHSLQKELKIFQILMNESIALNVDTETSLGKALQIMQENNFGSLLIYQDDTPVGILTETDIVKLAKENIDKKLPVKLYMHSPVIMVGLKTSMYECLEIMKKNNIRRLVVKENGDSKKRLYYVITSKDILNNLKGNYSKFLEAKLLSYRNTFDNLNDLIIETYNFEDSHVVSWINKSAKKRLNIEIDDVVEKLIPKSVLEETYKAFETQNTYMCNRVVIGEKIYRYSASKVALFDISIVKILLSDFTDLYLSNTKLKEQIGLMNESMNEQESMQLEILNQEAIGIGYSTICGEILFVNSYLRKLLGYEEDELIGKNIDDITFFQDSENSIQVRKQLVNNQNIDNLTLEKRYVQKNGNYVWVHISLSVSRDKMGKVKYVIAFVKDIEERKSIQKKLELSDGVFQNSNEGIIITDRDLKIQAVNPAFSSITQYSEEEVIGNNTLFLRSTYHDSEFYKQIWKSTLQSGYWKGEMWSVRKNGEPFPQWLNISTIKDSNGKIRNYIGIFFDITTMKQSEKELEFLAHHDPLTELPNRLLLSARLSQSIKRAKREAKKIALLFLDLDRFKEINDTFGHSYGDEILIKITQRFKSCMREKDTIARIGGDEFVFLIEDVEKIDDIESILEKILSLFDTEVVVNKQSFQLSASIGIAIYPNDGDNIEDLIKNADTAMYKAKDSGRNTYCFYTEEMTQDLFTKMLFKKEIVKALENEEFVLHYQPQVSLDSGRILGAEVLVRWEHPEKGLLYPDKFIALAEQTKLIIPIGKFILQKACEQMKEWIEQGVLCGRLAVNISAVQIQQNNLYQEVVDVLTQTKLSGSYLEFEITESFMMENPQASITLFKKFKNLGISFSIDDFGTGYSSLNYLKQLPVDKLKIDKSFIMDIPKDKEDIAITSTIIAMAKNLGLNVIAEGIETKEQHEFLKSSGCYEGQGYYYSKPLSKDDFVKFIE